MFSVGVVNSVEHGHCILLCILGCWFVLFVTVVDLDFGVAWVLCWWLVCVCR